MDHSQGDSRSPGPSYETDAFSEERLGPLRRDRTPWVVTWRDHRGALYCRFSCGSVAAKCCCQRALCARRFMRIWHRWSATCGLTPAPSRSEFHSRACGLLRPLVSCRDDPGACRLLPPLVSCRDGPGVCRLLRPLVWYPDDSAVCAIRWQAFETRDYLSRKEEDDRRLEGSCHPGILPRRPPRSESPNSGRWG